MSEPPQALPARDPESGDCNVVIETPKGHRNKFTWEPRLGRFVLSGVLPAGASFPFDFGYVPGTLGEDGDPLDVLLLMDEPAFPGCLVRARLLGAIEAEQTERDGTVEKNDRLIGVAAKSYTHRDLRALAELPEVVLEEIEHFFASYNAIRDKQFRPTARAGPERAEQLVREGEARAGTEA